MARRRANPSNQAVESVLAGTLMRSPEDQVVQVHVSLGSNVNETVIRTAGLAKRYQSGGNVLTVFDDMNLMVRQGERLALVGESGAGKSTLLHLLSGLDRPSEGKIYFGQGQEERDITTLTEDGLAEFRNREIGFVWQIHYLLPEFTALENVIMPLLMRGTVAREEAEALGKNRLQEVGLESRGHHRSGELSGGEQQRVVLARALVTRPRYLFADEPTGNLDERTGEMIAKLLSDLHRAHHLTSIYVTHNPRFAAQCDRVFRMEAGRLQPEVLDPRPGGQVSSMEAGQA